MTQRRKLITAAVLVATAALGTACAKAPTTPTDTNTATSDASIITATVDPLGSSFTSFQITSSTSVALTLAALTNSAGVPLPQTKVTLGLGTIDATGCAPAQSVETTAGFTAQIVVNELPGLYCAKVLDTGNLTETSAFTLRLVLTVGAPAPISGPGQETFSSTITPSGSVTHTVYASATGNWTTTLVSVDNATGPMSMAFGIWDTSSTACFFQNVSNNVVPGTQFVMPVDAGFYCVRLSDIGNLPAVSPFSIGIAHP